ncbi:hypothetical protein [Methylosinus sp. LW4]|uniref:hypothetical protein n=1 Tax=Methylosinus sp. LW4 TaxID=136993 RepID=UPI00037E0F25|nr:hypothetical protein [Methylosinus sp. LW4]
MATLLLTLRGWMRPLVAGAAACLFLWQALILAVSASAHHPHSGQDAIVCTAGGAASDPAPTRPDPSHHCTSCILGERETASALLAPVAVALLSAMPAPSAPRRTFADSPRSPPPIRQGASSPRAPPSIV